MARKNINILLTSGFMALAANMAQAAQTPQYTMRVPIKGVSAGVQTQQTGVGVGTLGSQSMAFGTVLLGTTSSPQTTTLQNTGTAPITLGTISTSGTNAADFAATTNCGPSLAVGASCNINVTFSPTTAGAETATLNIPNSTSSGLTVSLAGTSSDPYFSSVSLLMHMDNYLDSTGKNTLTTYGAPTISTSIKKMGTGALSLNGSSRLQQSYSSNYDFGAGDFTVEFWLYTPIAWTSQPSSAGIVGMKTGDTTNGWVLYRDGYYPSKINARITTQLNTCPTTSSPTTGVWEFWALTRQGTTVRWFKNGVLDATCSIPASASVTDSTATFYVGVSQTWGGYMNASLDELRITKGVARYTSNFTVPTSAFPNQ